jgi:ribonuclease HI
MGGIKGETIEEQAAIISGILVYTDGACSGNPGPGGWGAIVARPDGRIRELGGAAEQTTNNQMEMLATIEALREVRDDDSPVTICTDSTYVIRGITQWIWGWQKKGWKTAEGKDVSNKELWQELAREVMHRKSHGEIAWRYVRGHIGVAGNERVDEIAVEFSKGRRPRLFVGPLLQYKVAIYDLPAAEALPEPKPKAEKVAAYSYVSVLGSMAMRHATWADCERRVKGKPGAKFKKAKSADDERAILVSWGINPNDVK